MFHWIGTPRSGFSIGDSADVISSRWTVGLTLSLALIMTVRTYILSPIECHLNNVDDRGTNYLAFANSYCFVKGSLAAENGRFGREKLLIQNGRDWTEEEEKKLIGYYPWIPLYFGVTALLPYLIHILWKLFFTRHTSDMINDLLDDADKARLQNGEERRKTVERMSSYISDILWTKRQYTTSPLKGPVCAGFCLNIAYVVVKLAYLASHVVCMLAMHSFLNISKEQRYFGVNFLVRMLQGNFSDTSLLFPRITWCRVPLGQQGQVVIYMAQCILPGNLVSETAFALLWLWHAVFFFTMLISLIVCVVRACKDRKGDRFLRKGLTLNGAVTNPDDFETEERIHVFSRDFLQEDGVLTLRLLEKVGGGSLTSEVTAALWERYERMHDCLTLPRPPTVAEMDAGSEARLVGEVDAGSEGRRVAEMDAQSEGRRVAEETV